MSRLSRRSFLKASAALVAAPALGSRSYGADVDVVIVGAGAAGIAAARRVAAAKRSFTLIEASDRIVAVASRYKDFGVATIKGALDYNPDNLRWPARQRFGISARARRPCRSARAAPATASWKHSWL